MCRVLIRVFTVKLTYRLYYPQPQTWLHIHDYNKIKSFSSRFVLVSPVSTSTLLFCSLFKQVLKQRYDSRKAE